MSTINKAVVITLSVLALLAIYYLISSYNSGLEASPSTTKSPMNSEIENFEDPSNPVRIHTTEPQIDRPAQEYNVDASEAIEYIAQPQGLNVQQGNTNLNQLPSECYPKDVLSSVDLLPRDANSMWAQVNPSGQGSLADQNFLTSGFHIGINTVGQSLRNANRQIRSEPLNPQVKVSPWLQTTIEPDINRRPLEIQSDSSNGL